jgi:hypothetical protein
MASSGTHARGSQLAAIRLHSTSSRRRGDLRLWYRDDFEHFFALCGGLPKPPDSRSNRPQNRSLDHEDSKLWHLQPRRI